jgi:hypothetical protein
MCLACANIIVWRQLDEAGINKVVADMTRKYDETLSKAWVRESDEAIDESIEAFLEAPDNTTGYRAMLAVLTATLKGITNPQDVKRLTALTNGLYRVVKEAEVANLNTAYKVTQLDKGVIRSLANEGPYWIGNFYGDHLSERITEVGYQVTVEGGFGREAAGRTMKDVLRQEFALSGGASTYESTIPARFAGNVDNYSRIVSANVAQRSRVYSSISAMRDAEFVRYQFTAVMDERTSEVCQEMNGRIFTVTSAVKVLEEVSLSENPEDFKQAHPWPKNAESIRVIAGSGSAIEQSRNLEEAGIVMPPLHGMCRSSVEAID